MYCPECGSKVASDAKFCENCGEKIVDEDNIKSNMMESNSSFLKKANKRIQKSLNKNYDFDEKIDLKGINSVSIDDIARRLKIKKTKDGFFSPKDYDKMLKYAKKHTNSQKDLNMFRKRIDFVNNTQFD